MTFYHLRRLLGWASPDLDYERVANQFCEVFRHLGVCQARFCEVIGRAQSVVSSWGGSMTFVYLPSWYRYVPGRATDALAFKGSIERCVEREGIALIDFASVLTSSGDPLSFFSLGVNPHYNEAGYRRLVEAIRWHHEFQPDECVLLIASLVWLQNN